MLLTIDDSGALVKVTGDNETTIYMSPTEYETSSGLEIMQKIRTEQTRVEEILASAYEGAFNEDEGDDA